MLLLEWLSPAADVLSVVGFAMTLWVLVLTRSIKRTFALRARTPQLRRSLTAAVNSLRPLIKTWPQNRNEALGILANSRALLENLQTKLPRNERTTVDRVVRELNGRRSGMLRRMHPAEYSEDDLWKIFADLQAIVTSL
jgi:hypothetical protein